VSDHHPACAQHELATRDRHSRNPVGRSLWHIVWLLAVGHHCPAVARLTGYAEDWERTIITGTPTRFGAAPPWRQWAVREPPESNSRFNVEDANYGLGQCSSIFFISLNFSPESVAINCVVPAGTAISVGAGGAECSSVEPPSFFGRNEEKFRARSITMNDTVTDTEASINGHDLPNFFDHRTTSPLFTMDFPEDVILGGSRGLALAVADGYSFIIAPPPPGE